MSVGGVLYIGILTINAKENLKEERLLIQEFPSEVFIERRQSVYTTWWQQLKIMFIV